MKKIMIKSPIQADHQGHLSRRVREGSLIIFISLALYILVALMTHNGNDPGWSQTGANNEIMNLAGKTGAWFSDVLFFLFGYIAYILPPVVVLIGIMVYNPITQDKGPPIDLKASEWCIRVTGILLTL